MLGGWGSLVGLVGGGGWVFHPGRFGSSNLCLLVLGREYSRAWYWKLKGVSGEPGIVIPAVGRGLNMILAVGRV